MYRGCDTVANIDNAALFKISYGLFVVTSNDGTRDNGLIVNTVSQITDSPIRVAVAVNKKNYSHDVIRETKKMNVCCLSIDAPFSVFENFGFRSGRDADKFEGITPLRSENGLAVLGEFTSGFISLEVESYVDIDTHGMFICTVTEAKTLSDKESMTYTYYQENVKPKPEAKKAKGYVCKICGYVYEGDTLPDDFICPWCKHSASDFEKIQ
ncbi:MAG: flavin reductase [Clostridia bacterium]|nr:flavin reductase [Clostridia bacterium]